MLADLAQILVLILALALPVFIIVVSFRLHFILHASILLIVLLLGSVLAGASGLINIYRHLGNILQLARVRTLLTLLNQTQTFTRTLLSTVTSAIFIVKFFTKINASKETVNNSGIGFFILMLVAKFCCGTYKPMLCELLEILECCLDLVCLLSSGLFLCLLATTDPVEPLSEESPPLHLPRFSVMILNRLGLLLSLSHSNQSPERLLYQAGISEISTFAQNIFSSGHFLGAARPADPRHAGPHHPRPEEAGGGHGAWPPRAGGAGGAPGGAGDDGDPGPQAGERPHPAQLCPDHQLDVAARGVAGPGLRWQETVQEQHQDRSNITNTNTDHKPSLIDKTDPHALTDPEQCCSEGDVDPELRKHRSALEAVVSAPRRRRRKRGGAVGGGGPLDRVMLSMVGEKEIPLEESDEDEPTHCKSM